MAAGCWSGLLCVYQLLAWFPHYLTWPWWTDHDVFATAARAWDAGILPYRDFHLNNFPGTIYLFWFLGKAFGWTATPALYAFDSALVVAFGLLLCVWSRVQFGRLVPGLAGFALFLSYYLSLNYSLTAQRDWHAAFLAAAALMALQTWPRGGWIAASVCTAVAFSIRPQVLVFAPALVLALEQQVRHPGDSWRRAVRRTLAFALCTAVGLAVLFLPLVRAGVFNDFLLALRTLRPGGGYSDTSIARLHSTGDCNHRAVKGHCRAHNARAHLERRQPSPAPPGGSLARGLCGRIRIRPAQSTAAPVSAAPGHDDLVPFSGPCWSRSCSRIRR